jgi:hypothetical protein
MISEIQYSEPAKYREESLSKELFRLQNNIERLLDAYQEDLIHLKGLKKLLPGSEYTGINGNRKSN